MDRMLSAISQRISQLERKTWMSYEQLSDMKKGHELKKAELGNYLSREIPRFDAAISIR